MKKEKHKMFQLKNKELSSFCNQMSMMLQSGISISESISILLEDCQNDDEKTILTSIEQAMIETGNFFSSLKKTEIFPTYLLQMVRIGEETGTLDEVMQSLAHYYEREDAIAKSVKNAFTYPLIMIAILMIVIFVLVSKVMPIFNDVFRQLGQDLNGVSKAILVLGTTLSRYGAIFLFFVFVIILFFIYLFKAKSGKKMRLKLGHHIPFTKEIYHKIGCCKLAGALSLALKSGMIAERGLDFSKALVDNPYFIEKIDACKQYLQSENDLAQALRHANIFSGVSARLISIANKTGRMDEVMSDIANLYQDEIDEKVSGFIHTLEPTLVIILSIIVGVILLSVMLPLLGIMAGM